MSCTDCALHSNCSNSLVNGKKLGLNPKIMIVQDFPSRFDDRNATVPTGDTNSKLNYFLEKSGLKRSDVFFTSAIKCHVKNASKVKNKHINECRKYLLYEISIHRPKMILSMGKIAHQALTDIKNVNEFVGHFKDFSATFDVKTGSKVEEFKFTCKLLPTYSLLSSIRKWEVNGEMIRHFKKAALYIKEGKISKTPAPHTNLILSLEALREFEQRMLTVPFASTDCETTGFSFHKDKVFCVGYSSKQGYSDIIFVEEYLEEHWKKKWSDVDIDLAKRINRFVKLNKAEIIATLKRVNARKELKLILHNAKFDAKFVRVNGYPYATIYFDTLLADSLIDENVPHSLNFCLERRGINYGAYDTDLWQYTNKDEKKKKSYQFVPPALMIKYLGIDVDGDLRLFIKQIDELKKENLLEHFLNTKMVALKSMIRVEYRGTKMDKPLIGLVSRTINKEAKVIKEKLLAVTGNVDFNPNSGQQIAKFLYDNPYPISSLNIAITESGQLSTSKVELEKIVGHFNKKIETATDPKKIASFEKLRDFPKLILDIKKIDKLKGTYVDGKDGTGGMVQYLDKYHRVHANYNLWSPKTGRYSCNRPSLQVWPRPVKGLPNARNFVIPKKGWVLYEADYSQLEQCVVAVLSKDQVLISKIQNGTDLHCFNAAELGRQLNTIPKWVTYEHMMVANGKGDDLKDQAIIAEILADIEKFGEAVNWKETRTQAKNIGFGLNYGKGAKSFSEEFGITEDLAKDMVDAYFAIYPQMKAWRDKIVEQALKKGFITLLSGRKRRFHHATDWLNSEHCDRSWSKDILEQEISRQAMNFPVQGGAHEIFEGANNRLDARFAREKFQAGTLLSIHDGIIGECPAEEYEAVQKTMLEEMPVTFYKGTKLELTLKVDVGGYKDCWYGEAI